MPTPPDLPSFEMIRNANEARVKKSLERLVEERPGWRPDLMDLQDIYALALNSLTPRYRQRGTVVLCEPLSQESIDTAVQAAMLQVLSNPLRTAD